MYYVRLEVPDQSKEGAAASGSHDEASLYVGLDLWACET